VFLAFWVGSKLDVAATHLQIMDSSDAPMKRFIAAWPERRCAARLVVVRVLRRLKNGRLVDAGANAKFINNAIPVNLMLRGINTGQPVG
jgi:hypothetical protein